MRPERRFYFRLCKELGFAHPDLLLAQITSEQLSEWQAYDFLEPLGDYRLEYSLAQICSVIMSTAQSFAGGKNLNLTPTDFIPKWDSRVKVLKKENTKKSEVSTPEQIKELFTNIARVQQSNKGEKNGLRNSSSKLRSGYRPIKKRSI